MQYISKITIKYAEINKKKFRQYLQAIILRKDNRQNPKI